MNKQEMLAICQGLSAQFNDTFNIPIVINGRLTRTLGRCCYHNLTPDRIEISKNVATYCSAEEITQILKHEWVHYYITKITNERHGHDALFRSYCSKIGCAADKPKVELEGLKANRDIISKYTVTCEGCGKKYYYNRMTKKLRDLSFCFCAECNSSDLTLTQNY